ncbi:MAG TPA: hypothetical protein VGS80_11405 [Ktedonobacterales bacterium]|nr:hypothetical protein [Ktedonobacterales bacterium]
MERRGLERHSQPQQRAYTDDVLNGVSGASSIDVWAVGSATNQTYTRSGLIEHWDGTQWSLSLTLPGSTQVSQELYGVAARYSNDAWAVGRGNGPLVEHWNGANWSNMSFPTSSASAVGDDTIFGVASLASNNVWVVGGNAAASCAGVLPVLIAHWDGSKWSVVPNTPEGELYAIAAVSPNDIWAVGSPVMHWDGKSWSVVTSPSTSGFLRGVAATASNDVWAVGSSYGAHGEVPVTAHWNGHSWTIAQFTGAGRADNSLTAVAAVSAGEAWAVGAYDDYPAFQAGEARQALIEHYLA